jgi:hypothetical protein
LNAPAVDTQARGPLLGKISATGQAADCTFDHAAHFFRITASESTQKTGDCVSIDDGSVFPEPAGLADILLRFFCQAMPCTGKFQPNRLGFNLPSGGGERQALFRQLAILVCVFRHHSVFGSQ